MTSRISPTGDPRYSDDAIDHYDDDGPECPNCGGTGYSSHDCGEDCCACVDPQDNVRCDWCRA